MKKNSVLATCLLGAVIFSQPLLANNTYRTTTVETGDLNLESFLGRATLELRIQAAARKVCSQMDLRHFGDHQTVSRCIKNAKASAAEQVNRVVMNAKAKSSAA